MNWIKGNGLIAHCAKVAMLLVAMICSVCIDVLYADVTSGGKPIYYTHQKTGKAAWFALMANYGSYQCVEKAEEDKFTVYTPCKCQNCDMMAMIGGYGGQQYYTQFHVNFYTPNGTTSSNNQDCTNSNTWYVNNEFPITNQQTYQIGIYNTTNSQSWGRVDYNNVMIELADHLLLYDANNSYGTTNLTIDETSNATPLGQSKQIEIPFRSFLTKNSITIKMLSGDPTVFRVNNSTTACTKSNSFELLSGDGSTYKCGVRGESGSFVGTSGGRAGNASSVNAKVYYYPTSTLEQTATFIITDGTFTDTATIKAKGTSYRKDITQTTFNNSLNVESAGKPKFVGTTWYSIYQGSQRIYLKKHTISSLAVFPPCAGNLGLTFVQTEMGTADTYDTKNLFSLHCNGQMTYSSNNGSSNQLYRWTVGNILKNVTDTSTDSKCSWTESDISLTDYLSALYSIDIYSCAGKEMAVKNITLPLATHVLIDDESAFGTTTTSCDFTSDVSPFRVGSTIDYTFKLRSFLTQSNLIMKIENSDGTLSNDYKIVTVGSDIDQPANQYTVTSTANICGFPGGASTTEFSTPGTSVNTSDLPITIQYCPATAGTHTAYLKFYDNNDVVATVTLNGCEAFRNYPTLTIDNVTIYNHERATVTTSNYIHTNNDQNPTFVFTYTGDVVSIEENTITALKAGTATVTIDMGETDKWYGKSATFDVTVSADGVMTFDGNEGASMEWFDKENWVTSGGQTPATWPDASDDVQIAANCSIASDNGNALCKNMTFNNTTTKLTINADATLKASGSIASAAENILLKAEDEHSASVLFTSGSPKATVECWFRGVSTRKSTDSSSEDYNNMVPEWQYRGFIGTPDQTDNKVWDSKEVVYYMWDETNNASNSSCWEIDLNNPNQNAAPWQGFSMANVCTTQVVKTYTTTLYPTTTDTDGRVMNLTRSGNTTQSGLNLRTNSFSAPVAIDEIDFGTNVEAQIVFFRTNSNEAVKNVLNGSGTDAEKLASLYVTCPKNTSQLDEVEFIPAGASFFCFVNEGYTSGTLTLPVPTAQASDKMYAPRKEEFNVLKIFAESDSETDRVILVESDNCSHNYDDGYDGTKFLTDGMGQIYGTNSFGKTYIAADSSMLGQMIGFRAGSNDMTYRLRFDTERLTGYDELYLYDRVTKRYVNILEGSSYYFTGSTEGEDERFQIIGRMEDSDSFITGSDHALEVVSDRALLKGFDGEDEVIYMTDLAGKVVWSDNAKNGPWFELPTNIASGLYIIHCGDATAKYLKR